MFFLLFNEYYILSDIVPVLKASKQNEPCFCSMLNPTISHSLLENYKPKVHAV